MILYGKEVATHIKERISKKISVLSKQNIVPTLAIVQLTHDDSLDVYLKTRIKIGEELGINVEHYFIDNPTIEVLKKFIDDLNKNEKIWGIMIDEPFPLNLNKKDVISLIDPYKDVEGLSDKGKEVLYGINNVIPPAQAVIEVLKFYQIDMKNKNMSVIGGKGNCGKEIVKALEINYGKTNVLDKDTNDIPSISSKSDLVVVSIGKKELIGNEFVSKNAVLFDIGVHYNEENKLCGDVKKETYEYVKDVCPSPRGIGPVTNVILFENLLKLREIKK